MGFRGLFSLLALAALVSSSVGSSFVTGASSPVKLLQTRNNYRSVINLPPMRGGSDEEMQAKSDVPPPSNAEEDNPAPAVISDSSVSLLGPNAAPPGWLRRTLPSFPWHRLPNLLTYARCLAIPLLVVLFCLPNRHVETCILFAFASFTDWLDGYLARRWDITSAFGAFLDPVADKLMVSTALILLAGRYGAQVSIPTSIILAREIAVSALREWMAQRGQRDLVKVGMQGKIKTALTMISLTILLLVPTGGSGWMAKLYIPGLVMLDLCTLITVTSGSVYFIAAAPYLFEKS